MNSNVNYNELYYVRLQSVRSQFVAMPERYGSISTEELCGYINGKFPNGKPITFVQSMGTEKTRRGLIIPSAMGFKLLHKKIIDIFTENRFTGWESYPVNILCKNGDVDGNYHAFIVKGVCGPYDTNRSKVIDYTADNGGFILKEKRYQGMYFEPKSWDGTDIFMMKDTWITIVTSPVKEELERLNVKLNITKLSEHLLLDKVE